MELDEIETVLNRHPAVDHGAVVVCGSDEKAHLVAFYVAGADPVTIESLSSHVGRLPEAMVPRRWIPVTVLPLNTNGKVDYKVLTALAGGSQ